MLPDDALSVTDAPGAVLAPDNQTRVLLVDRELGGVAISDTTQGLQYRTWRAWYVSPDVRVAPEDDLGNYTSVNVGAGVTELSLSFDINMRITLAYVQSGVCKLYWYDSSLPGYTTTTFTGASTPFLALDDKRELANSYNDVILFYVKAGNLCCRYQRDRYLDAYEHTLQAVPPGRIVNVGMTDAFRIQLRYKVN